MSAIMSNANKPAAVAQRLLERTSTFARYLQLLRQFNAISAAVRELDPTERRKIGLTALAELSQLSTATTAPKHKTDWQVEAAVAFARARSGLPITRVAGIRRWLIAAYRATFESPYGEIQSLHRAVLRALRTMHGENPTVLESRMSRSA